MRLSVLAAPLLLASTTLARSPLRRGQATDTCANLDAELVFSDVVLDGEPYDAGHIDVGLCVSQVKMFVGHYNVTEAAAKVVGVDKVESAVIALIKEAGTQCTYPLHAKPTVTRNSECDFICTDGFLAVPANHPSSCVCPSHLTECDGKCGHFNVDCTMTPSPVRRQSSTPLSTPAGQVVDAAARSLRAATHEELSGVAVTDTVAGGKVPRTDTTSGLTGTKISDGKVSLNGASLDAHYVIPAGTKVSP